ncbi:hypothetical protein KKC32_04555 [Patescibacteria group bacterium]|nr:hypothetical protein [Patescibacteria group bacterium]
MQSHRENFKLGLVGFFFGAFVLIMPQVFSEVHLFAFNHNLSFILTVIGTVLICVGLPGLFFFFPEVRDRHRYFFIDSAGKFHCHENLFSNFDLETQTPRYYDMPIQMLTSPELRDGAEITEIILKLKTGGIGAADGEVIWNHCKKYRRYTQVNFCWKFRISRKNSFNFDLAPDDNAKLRISLTPAVAYCIIARQQNLAEILEIATFGRPAAPDNFMSNTMGLFLLDQAQKIRDSKQKTKSRVGKALREDIESFLESLPHEEVEGWKRQASAFQLLEDGKEEEEKEIS